jgi:glutaconyl-CoA/methylmalonyl-CoA decarboxylase subunit gamma
MKKFNFKIRGNDYEVEIGETQKNTINISVNGTEYQVEVEQELKESKTPVLKRAPINTHRPVDKKVDSVTTFSVTSPLPGNILQLFVQNGSNVKVGDKLLLYEAMKMENIITAEKDGVISNLKVGVGDNVLQDVLLMEII